MPIVLGIDISIEASASEPLEIAVSLTYVVPVLSSIIAALSAYISFDMSTAYSDSLTVTPAPGASAFVNICQILQ